jgi:KNOX1 domain/KNOX2 domain
MEMGVGFGAGECSSSVVAAAALVEEEHHHHQLLKAEIAVHPLCEQLLSAHVACLRVATPIDHLPLIDAQLTNSHSLLRSYAAQHRPFLGPNDKQDLDSFLVIKLDTCIFKLLEYSMCILIFFFLIFFSMFEIQSQYLMVLCSFREQLQQHVREHAVEAVMACREIEQSLQDLTGTYS